MTGRSRQSVAAVARRERERDETLGVEEIRGSGCGCDRRRGGPGSQGGGGGGASTEDWGISARICGIRDGFGGAPRGRTDLERWISDGIFPFPGKIFCASGGFVNFVGEGGGRVCVWWCTCLSRRGGGGEKP